MEKYVHNNSGRGALRIASLVDGNAFAIVDGTHNPRWYTVLSVKRGQWPTDCQKPLKDTLLQPHTHSTTYTNTRIEQPRRKPGGTTSDKTALDSPSNTTLDQESSCREVVEF